MPDDWKTIRVPKDVYDDAKLRKEEHGVTWGEYVNPHAWHSVFDEPKDVPEDTTVEAVDIDADKIAQVVVERLEGSKPLEDMAFDDWFEPDHAQTVALQIVDELEDLELEVESDSSSINESTLAEYLADYLVNGSNLPAKVAEELR